MRSSDLGVWTSRLDESSSFQEAMRKPTNRSSSALSDSGSQMTRPSELTKNV